MKNWIMEQMVMNREMKKLLKRIDNKKGKKLTIRMDQLEKLLNPSFKKIKDCIIIMDEDEEISHEHFDRILEMCIHKTAYEAGSNEIWINDFFEKKISMKTGTKIALLVLEIWAAKLKKLEPETRFCLIMYSNEERVKILFHKFREDEMIWVGDMENYKGGAVGYVII